MFRLEHKFLISDNRHYMFYIWKRTVKRTQNSKYFCIPFYAVCISLFRFQNFTRQRLSFVLLCSIATSAVLIPQELLEFRYFIIPFFMWRLHQPSPPSHEFLILLYYCIIHIATGLLFCKYPILLQDGKIEHFMW